MVVGQAEPAEADSWTSGADAPVHTIPGNMDDLGPTRVSAERASQGSRVDADARDQVEPGTQGRSRTMGTLNAFRDALNFFGASVFLNANNDRPRLSIFSPSTRAANARSLEASPTQPVDDDCPICLAPLAEDCVATPCKHTFHAECLRAHALASHAPGMRARCPLCRAPIEARMPVEARAASGRPIETVGVPEEGARCHFDRAYTFTSLGDFRRPRMLYLLTCNEDRKTPSSSVMWTLEAQVPVTVYLNFRSSTHASAAGVPQWLRQGGWRPSALRSTVSTGIPNGPYSGPVFEKECEPGSVALYGSNCWEGTYFVFVQMRAATTPAGTAQAVTAPFNGNETGSDGGADEVDDAGEVDDTAREANDGGGGVGIGDADDGVGGGDGAVGGGDASGVTTREVEDRGGSSRAASNQS
uniref:RING-type domain-containing protein n=1 Tax=Chrysotila carterae TaxID=13221 RepID=A0A7S4B8V4_CHRCT